MTTAITISDLRSQATWLLPCRIIYDFRNFANSTLHIISPKHRPPAAFIMAPRSAATTKASQASKASHKTAVNVLQTFPFLKLPAELRNKIYRSLLVFDRALVPFRIRVPHNFDRDLRRIDVAIIRVNKQVYSEACAIWLEENEFVYQEIYDTVEVGPRGGCGLSIRRRNQQRFIAGQDILEKASRIRATFGRNDMISDFVEILVSNRNLTHLTISFHGMTNDVLMACKKAMPRLEKVQVRNEVFFDFRSRWISGRSESYIKKERTFEDYLSTLKEKMLEK